MLFHISGDFAAETALQLLVDDVNDNPPYFVEDPVIIGIAEEIPFNTIIGHLQVCLYKRNMSVVDIESLCNTFPITIMLINLSLYGIIFHLLGVL